MVFRKIDPRRERVPEEAAQQRREGCDPRSQGAGREDEEPDTEHHVAEEMREIAVQRECGAEAPPVPGGDHGDGIVSECLHGPGFVALLKEEGGGEESAIKITEIKSGVSFVRNEFVWR